MPAKLMLCLMLLCLALPATATEANLLPPSDGCQAVQEEDETETSAARVTEKPAQVPSKPREAGRRGGAETTVRPPRWHSFLPGMFR